MRAAKALLQWSHLQDVRGGHNIKPQGEPWLPEHEGGARGDIKVLMVLVAPFDPEYGVFEGVLHGALQLHHRPNVNHKVLADPTYDGGTNRTNWGQWDSQHYIN